MFYFSKKKGFTLVEIIIAISVFSIGILGAMSMFSYGVKAMKYSQSAISASQLIKEKVEDTISVNYDDVSTGTFIEDPLSVPFSGFRRQTEITYVDPSSALQEVSTDNGVKKIEVTVFWKSMFGLTENSIKRTTLLSKK